MVNASYAFGAAFVSGGTRSARADRAPFNCPRGLASLLQDLEHACRRVSFPLGRYKGGARGSACAFADYYDPPATRPVRAAFGWELDYFRCTGPSEEWQRQIASS